MTRTRTTRNRPTRRGCSPPNTGARSRGRAQPINATPTTAATDKYLRRVGSQRPNALLYSDGVGAVVDLPHLSVVVQGLDYWDYRQATDFELTEPRLLQRVRQILGPQVRQLRATPHREDTTD